MKCLNMAVVAQLLAICATPQPSAAQSNCGKIVRVSEDRLTRKKRTVTTGVDIYRPVGKHILGLLGGADKSYDYNLVASFTVLDVGTPALFIAHTGKNGYTSEITTVVLRLTNDSLMTFTGSVSVPPKHDEYSDYETTFTAFFLTEQDLQYLKQDNISMLRIVFNSDTRPFEKTLDSKTAAEFRNLVSCFAEKVPKIVAAETTSGPAQPQLQAGATPAQPVASGNQVAPLSGDDVASVVGPYTRTGRVEGRGDKQDVLVLAKEGVFMVRKDSQAFAEGKYRLHGDSLFLVKGNGETALARIAGGRITESDGAGWQRAAQVQKVTIDQIILMVEAKLPDDVIIARIEKAGTTFDLTPEDMIRLKKAGASDAILRAMSK